MADRERAEPDVHEMLALAHAVDPALRMLEVVAHAPVQGEAMHKVIGYHAYDALLHVGWLGPYGIVPGGLDVDPAPHWRKLYVIEEPASRTGGRPASASSRASQPGPMVSGATPTPPSQPVGP